MKLTKQWLYRFVTARTLAVGVLALAAIGVSAGNASADWHSFWHKFHVDTARNNAWPDPFNEADARDTVAPFEVMKRNGWKLHNTIGHDLFREGDGVLMASGTNRVRWIATQAPESRRTIFVLKGNTHLETEARLASVRQTLSGMNLDGGQPSVAVTSVQPAKASGVWAAKISRDGIAATPRPQLPQTSSSGTQSAGVASGTP
ncbi:hypothetical protein LF1_34650 [Rubripirellula obstinata]|uniref:Uncharacterized protein n=1 Tax=Rubripirellula obstinata TaxID=406547 RepID=A0A5B1CNJ1_9BACT|nr:hypothetical protein [Rubripirellula obstinata]KAA1260923.1 hypothetical protein LF1_34650 [Rubripirellula obstinata]